MGAISLAIGAYAQRPCQGDDGRPSTGWHAEFDDIDNDGRLDLFIAKGNVDQMPGLAMADPCNLLMQQDDGTFIEYGGTDGIATTDLSRGDGLAGGSALPAHFGIGPHETAALRVIWPDGTAGDWRQAEAGGAVAVSRP